MRRYRLFGIWCGLLPAACMGSSRSAEVVMAPARVEPATTPHAPDGMNPFAGARFYADPDYVRTVTALAARVPEQAAALRRLAATPTSIWLSSIELAKSASRWLDDAARQQAAAGAPVVPVFVIYDLPSRDCAAESSNGELAVESGGEGRYQREYIDLIAAQFRAHASQRIVAVLEPDSLANLATNLGVDKCAAAEAAYRRSVAYAVAKLSLPNVFLYLDAAHAGWLGWKRNLGKIAAVYKDVLDLAGGPDRIRGFAVNVSNYDPVKNEGGRRVDPNEPGPDELTYVEDLGRALAAVGITNKGFIIDTSRNGRPGIRSSGGNWCNIKGAGLGERPRAQPAPSVDAYFWIKIPGESDGTSDPSAPRFDKNCVSDDAAPGAPQAGHLFEPYLLELVKNANPPL
jgi:cellulose 1,4-beta-cellobiosidase